MNFQEFLKQFNSGKVFPVYFFYGAENYFKNQALDIIFSKYVTSQTSSFNRDIFYGDDGDAAKIVNTVLTIPMMSEKRVVVVKNYQRLSQPGKELILKYCKQPVSQTILVLVAEEIDFRNKIYSSLRNFAECIECKPPYDNQVPMYISQFSEKRGKKISLAAINLLQSKSGNSLGELISQVEKLISYTGDKEIISEDDVEKLVGISRNYNIFQLRDAIGDRRISESLTILRRMIEMGESPVYIVSSLTSFFTVLIRARELIRKRIPRSDMAKQLGVHPYFLDATIRQAKSYTDSEINTSFVLLLEADKNLKISYQKAKIVMEILVFQILNQMKAA